MYKSCRSRASCSHQITKCTHCSLRFLFLADMNETWCGLLSLELICFKVGTKKAFWDALLLTTVVMSACLSTRCLPVTYNQSEHFDHSQYVFNAVLKDTISNPTPNLQSKNAVYLLVGTGCTSLMYYLEQVLDSSFRISNGERQGCGNKLKTVRCSTKRVI